MLNIKYGESWASNHVRIKGEKQKGLVLGLEIELEGNVNQLNSTYWTTHNEQSLRPNPYAFEYVFAHPLTYTDAMEAVDVFVESSKNWTIKASNRCSTHIHVNVAGRKHYEILSALTLYLLVEEVLVTLMSNNRVGNLHCLRASDAEAIPVSLVKLASVRDLKVLPYANPWLTQYPKDLWKYGAINLAAIGLYGSLEFRFLDPMWKGPELKHWLGTLSSLVSYGLETPIEQWFDRYDKMSVKDFLSEVFGAHVTGVIGDRTSNELNHLMHTNYSYVSDIVHGLASQKYRMSVSALSMEFGDLVYEDEEGMEEDLNPDDPFTTFVYTGTSPTKPPPMTAAEQEEAHTETFIKDFIQASGLSWTEYHHLPEWWSHEDKIKCLKEKKQKHNKTVEALNTAAAKSKTKLKGKKF